MKSTNKKWFTLVELIIVITILAILATIAFISFQWYSSEARDSGKMSELSEVVKTIAIKEARDTAFKLNNIGSWATGEVWNWSLNKSYLWLNSKNEYAVAIQSWVYVIAAKMEKYDTTTAWVLSLSWSNYFVIWNWFLSSTWVQISSGSTVSLTGLLDLSKAK